MKNWGLGSLSNFTQSYMTRKCLGRTPIQPHQNLKPNTDTIYKCETFYVPWIVRDQVRKNQRTIYQAIKIIVPLLPLTSCSILDKMMVLFSTPVKSIAEDKDDSNFPQETSEHMTLPSTLFRALLKSYLYMVLTIRFYWLKN